VDILKINQILEVAPAKIAEYAEKENASYAEMIKGDHAYRQERARAYLRLKAEGGKAIKDIEYILDDSKELGGIKAKTLEAEIAYRAWKTKKNKAQDSLQSVMEIGRNVRAELKSLGDNT